MSSYTEPLFLWVLSLGTPSLVKWGFPEIVHHLQFHSWFALSSRYLSQKYSVKLVTRFSKFLYWGVKPAEIQTSPMRWPWVGNKLCRVLLLSNIILYAADFHHEVMMFDYLLDCLVWVTFWMFREALVSCQLQIHSVYCLEHRLKSNSLVWMYVESLLAVLLCALWAAWCPTKWFYF